MEGGGQIDGKKEEEEGEGRREAEQKAEYLFSFFLPPPRHPLIRQSDM